MNPFQIDSRLLPTTALVTAVICSSALLPQTTWADTGNLDEIVVKGQIIRPQDSAYSATTLDSQQIRDGNFANTDEMLRLVPGMSVRDFQLGGVASGIVIRGFGNGGHGGDLGAVVDGIPLNEAMSHADGYVDLNVISPLEIETFSVLKGPVSALYGNFNRGGLVNIQTRKSGDYLETDLMLGTDDLFDLQAAYGAAIGDRQQVNLAGRYFRTEGYRPQSDSDRKTLSARWALDVTEDLQVALSTRLHESTSDSASYITRQQFNVDRDGIDPRVQNDGADKHFVTVRADVNYEINQDLKLLTFGYTTQQDFTRWFSRPVSATAWRQREENYDRSVYGLGTNLNGRTLLADRSTTYTVGVESFHESTDYMFFDGLDRRRRTAAALNDRDTSLNSVSAFAEAEAVLHPLAQVSLGVRADRFTGGCELRGPETGTDPCGSLNKAEHVSPKVGVRSQVTDWMQFRASWAEGFALPNGFVKYAIGGQPLDENVFRQTEIGMHIESIARIDFDVAAYRLISDGEVRTVSPGVYENFGATRRRGIEASATWRPVPRFDMRAVYGLSETEVTQNADARLLGLDIPGVPKDSASIEFNVSPFTGWTLNGSWQWVGEYAVDALNTLNAAGYDLFDVGIAYNNDGARPYRAYARIENVTDRQYATSVSLIGGQEVLAPGAPRIARVGVQFNF